jgi:simple sugar transport system ATP-binding protein
VTQRVALALEAISKRFGTTDALRDASLTIRPGAIHALLGENGAGKTTLMRVAYGLVQPDRGVIRDGAGHPMRLTSPAAAIAAGIGMVHQHFTIVHAMTVAENVALGGRGRFDRRATAARVREIAATIAVTLDPDAPGSTLSVPVQQQLEIIKALSHDVRLLILDEPTAVLAPVEVQKLMSRLRMLASAGLAIVLITHKLRDALAIADEVTVLRQGTTVLSAPASTLTEAELATAMVGPGWVGETTVALPSPTRRPASSTVPTSVMESDTDTHPVRQRVRVVSARGVSVLDARGVRRVREIDLEVHAGEIVGIAGVAGSGVRELLRAIAGRSRVSTGSLETTLMVGFVPEDRHHEAITLDFSLTENVALRGAGTRRGLTRWGDMRLRTRSLLEAFDVRAAGPEAAARSLSGGNQQKLVLARELDGSPALLVAENPTRGLDLRATAAIHARLRTARDAGMAIIVYSSDLDELVTLADRTFAMFAGALVAVRRDRQALGQAMLGTSTPS